MIVDHPERKTAGELSKEARADTTVYDSLEAAYALTEDIAKQLEICVQNHDPIFNEDEYYVVQQYAGDPLIGEALRRKFYADLFLPDPRPRQAVFLWNKRRQQFTARLWVLPDVESMEILYQITNVHPKWKSMQAWAKAFYDGKFWELIREQHGQHHLSKSEYSKAHAAELSKACGNKVVILKPHPFDFSKIAVNQVIDPKKIGLDQSVF